LALKELSVGAIGRITLWKMENPGKTEDEQFPDILEKNVDITVRLILG
jgi:hypothetical protein